MTTINHPTAALSRCCAIAIGVFVVAQLNGQSAATAATAEQLAKYDKNKNGVLDAGERAQMEADEDKSGAIVLSPFEVTTSKDRGYAAGNTLSGGRVDTPIAITPGSISVMTKEFMDDFNITNMNDALQWTVGMESGTLTPGSDPFGASTYGTLVRGAVFDSNFPQRNGSLYYGVADSYNSERFEFNRGPDTSIFGDGGPGGRQGSSAKRARLNYTATGLSAQIDTYKGYRGTMDYNKGFDRFALRVNALRQNNRNFQDATDLKSNGITIDAVVKLGKNTTFIADYERKNERNNLWSKTMGDNTHLWDGTTVNTNNASLGTTAVVNALGLSQVSATNDYLVWNFATNSLLNYKGNQYVTRGLGYRIPWNGGYPFIPKFQRGIDKFFNLAPADAYAERDTGNWSYTLEHRAGNFFVQLGYWRNDFDVNTLYAQIFPNQYQLDVNRLLPDGITPNPKFLKAYGEAQASTQYQQDFVREYKGLATYKFFVPKFFDFKQQLSTNFGWRRTRFEQRGNSWRWANNPAVADAQNVQNQVRYRVYWDDPRAQLSSIFTDPNKVAPAGMKFVYIEEAPAVVNIRTLKYVSLISQTAFFNEKLAITGSLRRDDVRGDFLPRLSNTGAPDYKNIQGFQTANTHLLRHQIPVQKSAGVVTYPFPSRYRWLSPIGFVFNYASNIQQIPSTPNPLYDGSEVPLVTNTTRDYGVRYSMPDGLAYVTVSHYDTKQLNSNFGMGNVGDMRNIWINLGYTDPEHTASSLSYADLRSNKLEGWEVELTANPMPNLTFTVNYSHPLNYTISDSEQKKKIYADNIAEWTAGAKATAGTLLNGKRVIDPTIIQQSILNIENSLNGLTEGTLNNGSARHRINVAGRYGFREGMLKGFGFNAGVVYRAHTKVGSRDPRLKFGLTDAATVTLAQTKEAAYDYLWVAPYYTVSAGANYTRRFGKYSARFQINVANLLDNQDLIFNGYGVITTNQLLNGNPRMQVKQGWTQIDPRKFTFSTTLNF
jgi:hypothetical protein